MTNLLKLQFWFNLKPTQLLPLFQNLFFIFLAMLFVFIVFLKIILRKKKVLYSSIVQKLLIFSWVNIFLGFMILFFNYEQIPFLSSRFWFLIWGTSMVAWLMLIIKNFKKIPLIKKEIEEKKQFNKYIP